MKKTYKNGKTKNKGTTPKTKNKHYDGVLGKKWKVLLVITCGLKWNNFAPQRNYTLGGKRIRKECYNLE